MLFACHRLTNAIGVEVRGIDLRQELDSATISDLRNAWLEATVLVIRQQFLDPADLIRFTCYFGTPTAYTRSENALESHPQILVLTNLLKPDGTPMGTPVSGRYWHTDGHYLPCPPAASVLYSVEVPAAGGDTYFANCAAAYEALSPEVRSRVDGLKVIISQARARLYHYPDRPPAPVSQSSKWLDTAQPFVRTHPETGRRALYIGGGVPWHVEGMSEEESTPLVVALQEFCTDDRFVYCHRWQPGDLVLMDNRSSIHRGSPYDLVNTRRLLYRTSIAGDLPYFGAEPRNASRATAISRPSPAIHERTSQTEAPAG